MIDGCDHLHRDGRVMAACSAAPVFAFSATAPDGVLSWWGACSPDHLEPLITALVAIDFIVPSAHQVRRRHATRLKDGRSWPRAALAEPGWRPPRREVARQRVPAPRTAVA